jgi:uncharacterized protein
MKIRALISLLFILATACHTAFGASFDCQRPASYSEKSICSDEELFSLDDELAEAYVAALREAPNLRESQRGWLKRRNLCQNRECLVAAYRERIAELSGMIVKEKKPLSFDGEWEVEWSCEGATDLYAKRCAEGVRDYFHVVLSTKNNLICGNHEATAQLGNKVDDGSSEGTIAGGSATIEFTSSWGDGGMAVLKIEGDKLRWHVLKNSNGSGNTGFVPDDATLTRTWRAVSQEDRSCLDALPTGMGGKKEDAAYLASKGLSAAAPHAVSANAAAPSNSRVTNPPVREHVLAVKGNVDGFVNRLALAPGRSDMLVASVGLLNLATRVAENGIYLISIAVPDQPKVLGFFPVGDIDDIAVSPDGKRVYYIDEPYKDASADKKFGLGVVDVSNPARPSRIAQIEGDFMAMHLSADGGTLYLQERSRKPSFSRGLMVYATGSAAPALLCRNTYGKSRDGSPFEAYSFASFPGEPLLAIKNFYEEIIVFDVNNRCAPKRLMHKQTQDGGREIAVGLGRTLVMSGLKKYKIGNTLEAQASYSVKSYSSVFHVNNVTDITIAEDEKGIAIFRSSPDGNFVLTDRIPIPGKVIMGAALSTATGHVYVGGNGGWGVSAVPLSGVAK